MEVGMADVGSGERGGQWEWIWERVRARKVKEIKKKRCDERTRAEARSKTSLSTPHTTPLSAPHALRIETMSHDHTPVVQVQVQILNAEQQREVTV
jgi:hypothetical protein